VLHSVSGNIIREGHIERSSYTDGKTGLEIFGQFCGKRIFGKPSGGTVSGLRQPGKTWRLVFEKG